MFCLSRRCSLHLKHSTPQVYKPVQCAQPLNQPLKQDVQLQEREREKGHVHRAQVRVKRQHQQPHIHQHQASVWGSVWGLMHTRFLPDSRKGWVTTSLKPTAQIPPTHPPLAETSHLILWRREREREEGRARDGEGEYERDLCSRMMEVTDNSWANALKNQKKSK